MGHEHKYMGHETGHETTNWGGRGVGYMLFITHLCNQPCYCQVVGEPGAQLCTLLEVWVLGVGMLTLGRQRLCTTRIGDSQVPMTLEHVKTNVSLGSYVLLDWSTLNLSGNKKHLLDTSVLRRWAQCDSLGCENRCTCIHT
jgi:hypothetical protein